MINVITEAYKMGLEEEDLCGGPIGDVTTLLANLANLTAIVSRYEQANDPQAWLTARSEIGELVANMHARQRVQKVLDTRKNYGTPCPPHHI